MRLLLQTVICVLALLPFSGRMTQATTTEEYTFPDLVHQAESIIVGTVADVREQWDATRSAPLTYVTFSNLTVLKGAVQQGSMTLEFLGGHQPDGTLLVVHGVPRFSVGEKNVVFCNGNRRDFCPLVGLWQGLFRVETEPQLGREIVSNYAHLPFIGLQNGELLEGDSATPSQQALSLPTLLEFIRNELRNRYK